MHIIVQVRIDRGIPEEIWIAKPPAVCLQRPLTILETDSALLFTLHGWPTSSKQILLLTQCRWQHSPKVHSSTTTNNNTTVLLRRQHAVPSRAAVGKLFFSAFNESRPNLAFSIIVHLITHNWSIST